MADKKGLPEPKDLDEAKSQIVTLVSGLDASQETVGELTNQIKTMQENADASSKSVEGAEKLQTAVTQLTKERDEAVSENRSLTEENAKLSKISKDVRAERDRIKELRKQDSVQTRYRFECEDTYASITLAGESVAPEKSEDPDLDGTWMLNLKQHKEAVAHGCLPVMVGTPGEE